jgi:hypothetical protein
MAQALSGVNQASAPYLLPLEFDALVRIIRNLMPLHVRDRRLNDDMLEWTHKVRKLYAVRTAVVHSVWQDAAEPGGGAWPVWSNAGAADHPLTVADLSRAAQRLLELCDAPLLELRKRLEERAPALGLTAPERSAGHGGSRPARP